MSAPRSVVRWMVAGTALATAFLGGVAAAGGFAGPGPDGPGTGPGPTLTPVSSRWSLTASDSCADLLKWYIRKNIGDVGPYGWTGSVVYGTALPMTTRELTAQDATSAPAAGTPEDGRAASATGTNTQEADVDEPDVAKTDGRMLVRIVEGNRLEITDVTGSKPRHVGSYRLPAGSYGEELLLVRDHVLVTASQSSPVRYLPGPTDSISGVAPRGFDGGFADRIMPAYSPSTTLLDVDVSDPARPELVREDTWTGGLLSARQYGDVVRVVTSTPRPQFRWYTPGMSAGPDAGPDAGPGAGSGTGRLTPEEATARNRELVRESTVEDWLPAVETTVDGRTSTARVGCADVLHTRSDTGTDTLAVHTIDVDTGETDAVALTTGSRLVYSSADRLYVATSRWASGVGAGGFWRWAREKLTKEPSSAVTTSVHAFALDGTDTTYVGSGHVAGTVKDRWSMDEQDGRLRVAVGLPDRHGVANRNGIAVLSERDGALVLTGGVGDLGVDEEIKAVRWYDDLALVVTFRQTDPFYTVDLSDPDHPRVLGELKIDGFSGYLHPLGGDLVLGLGQDADSSGRVRGAQAAVFDISDLAHPQRVGRVRFGPGTSLPAVEDPRAFTWLPQQHAGVTRLQDWDSGGAGALVLDVGSDGSLTTRRVGAGNDRSGGSFRALPLDDGRVALVGSDVELADVS